MKTDKTRYQVRFILKLIVVIILLAWLFNSNTCSRLNKQQEYEVTRINSTVILKKKLGGKILSVGDTIFIMNEGLFVVKKVK